MSVYKKQEILKRLLSKEEEKVYDLQEKLEKIDNKHKDMVKAKLEWEYEYNTANNMLTKSSVTKIKNMKLNLEEEEREIEYNVPEFMKEEKSLTPAEKGTIMHLILQKLDISIDYDKEKIELLVNDLAKRNVINEKQKEAVDIDKVYGFTKANIWKEMKNAKKVERERPFYINVPAKEVYEEDIDENILVQGIIDLYYITDNDEIVLVDYKTDRVKTEAELIEKYREQLKLYKEALERALEKKMDRVYIYSVWLDKEIEV